jgi:putative ABC transport system permease protein
MTGLKAGDTLTIVIDKKEYDVKVAAITENYLYHYVYMSRECYKDTFGEEPEDNAVVYKTSSTEENAYKAVGKKTLGIDGVLHVTYASATKSQLDNMLSALDAVIVVLVVAAGMLAFVVIYNLNNININERQRELATLKVLGFYNNEVAVYIYRENIWLTLAGCVAGCFLGKILHTFIIQTVEIDTCMFGRIIELRSYIYSTLFTVAFAVIVNLVMYFKLKQIDMIASLKSAE